ncbi:unnamed protein product [Sphagnum compactum]
MAVAKNSWRRMELWFLIAYAVVFQCYVVYRSVRISEEYSKGPKAGWLNGLRQGWIMNQLMDLSDSQWRTFRAGLPALTGVMAIFTILAGGLKAGLHLSGRAMAWFWLIVSLSYIAYLHGACVVFILAIAISNFAITKAFGGTRALPILIWTFNIGFLVANRVYEGYRFSSFGEQLAHLDQYRGVMRWQISFNFVILRMLSFSLDYHWARILRPSTVNWEKHAQQCDLCTLEASEDSKAGCYLARQERPVPLFQYEVVMYLAYVLYAPLYLAGPIVSFNAFASQLEKPQRTYSGTQIAVYGLRWLACFLLMEVLTQFCYFNTLAISGVWQMLSPTEIFLIGYGVLNFMWLKFLLIWRFFRFWTLVNGIEAPENMTRCMNNCYDLEGFWKGWHSSYNRYLVRYLYIPLGGSKWRLINVWIIFTFVAIWHDLEWKLLSWAWVTCLLWVPELVVKSIVKSHRMEGFRNSPLFRECCALAGSFNTTGLMTANLVGFVVGPAGMHMLFSRMLSLQNIPLLFGIVFSMYIGTKIMFHIREWEVQQKENEKLKVPRSKSVD